MAAHTVADLTNAALFGLASAGIALVLIIIGLCVWQVWQAVYSPQAKRKRAFNNRLVKYNRHYRKLLNLSN